MLTKWTRVLLVLFAAFGICMWFEASSAYAERFLGHAETGRLEDYVDFYAAGHMVLRGDAKDIYDLEAIGKVQRSLIGLSQDATGFMPFSNPPFVALAYAPLSLLSLSQMSMVIAAAELALIAAFCVVLLKIVKPSSTVEGVLVVTGVLSLWPLIMMFALGQQTLLLILAWLGWLWLEKTGRQGAGGVVLALLLIKPHLALIPLGVLVWKQRWTTLQGFLAAGAVMAAVSVLMSGPHVVIDYPNSLLDRAAWDHIELGHHQVFYGWDGFLWQFFSWGSVVHYGLIAVLTLVTLGALTQAWRGDFDVASPRFFYAVSATMLATILVSPHLLLHDLVFVVASLALSARAAQMQTGNHNAWLLAGVFAWFVLLIGPMSGINFVTPMIFGLLVANVLQARSCEAVESNPWFEAGEAVLAAA